MAVTREDFIAFYPIFEEFQPAIVMDEYLRQANARVEDFGEDADEARRLYAAHRLVMYARVALPEGQSSSMRVIAAAGEKQQRIASKKVGEVAVTYAASSSNGSASSTAFADLTETDYGLQLLGLIRMYSYGRYVP